MSKLTDHMRLIGQTQAARLLGVHPKTLLAWRRNNTAPECVRIGKRCYFKLQVIESWLRARAG